MRPLELFQRCTIADLAKMKIGLGVVGVEEKSGCPVLRITDQRRIFAMTVLRDGAGRDPVAPVRAVLPEEQWEMCEADAAVLLQLPFAREVTDDLLETRWLTH